MEIGWNTLVPKEWPTSDEVVELTLRKSTLVPKVKFGGSRGQELYQKWKVWDIGKCIPLRSLFSLPLPLPPVYLLSCPLFPLFCLLFLLFPLSLSLHCSPCFPSFLVSSFLFPVPPLPLSPAPSSLSPVLPFFLSFFLPIPLIFLFPLFPRPLLPSSLSPYMATKEEILNWLFDIWILQIVIIITYLCLFSGCIHQKWFTTRSVNWGGVWAWQGTFRASEKEKAYLYCSCSTDNYNPSSSGCYYPFLAW